MNRRTIREHVFRMVFQKDFYDREELPGQLSLYLEEVAAPQEEKDFLLERAAGLSAEEMMVIQLSLQDKSQLQVAQMMGVQQPKVSKLMTSAIYKIRYALRLLGWDEPGQSSPESLSNKSAV